MLPDSVDMHFKDIRQTFKSEMEVCMGTIFHCITPCRFGSTVPYYPSVHAVTRSDTQLSINMAWHNQLHLELKKSVFMLPFCLKLCEGLMNLRNINMESSKVILIGNREFTSITENLCGGNHQKTLGTGKPVQACSNCYTSAKVNGIRIYIAVFCTLECLLHCCLLIGFFIIFCNWGQ